MNPESWHFPPELLVRFREIRIEPGRTHTSACERLCPKWEPPREAAAFSHEHDTGWLVWRPSSLELLEDQNVLREQVCSTTTMFFCPRRYGFVHVPYDCMDADAWRIADGNNNWQPLTFEQPEDVGTRETFPCLWKIGNNFHKNEVPLVITDSWRDLLPPPYFINAIDTSRGPPTCEFAGSLSLLLSLVGFAASWQDLDTMVREGFRPHGTTEYKPTWRIGIACERGATPYRGLIVDVASRHWRKSEIKDVEAGLYGPILTSNPRYVKNNLASAGYQQPNPRANQPPVPPSTQSQMSFGSAGSRNMPPQSHSRNHAPSSVHHRGRAHR